MKVLSVVDKAKLINAFRYNGFKVYDRKGAATDIFGIAEFVDGTMCGVYLDKTYVLQAVDVYLEVDDDGKPIAVANMHYKGLPLSDAGISSYIYKYNLRNFKDIRKVYYAPTNKMIKKGETDIQVFGKPEVPDILEAYNMIRDFQTGAASVIDDNTNTAINYRYILELSNGSVVFYRLSEDGELLLYDCYYGTDNNIHVDTQYIDDVNTVIPDRYDAKIDYLTVKYNDKIIKSNLPEIMRKPYIFKLYMYEGSVYEAIMSDMN